MTDSAWMVQKFGGTSLADAERYAAAADLVLHTSADAEGRARRPLVVVSASRGVTDRLLDLVRPPAGREPSDRAGMLADLRTHHAGLARELLATPEADAYRAALDRDLEDVAGLLSALDVLGTAPAEASSLISGYGEVWSARLLAGVLRGRGEAARWLDARDVLRVEHAELGPVVQWQASGEALEAWLAHAGDAAPVVATGYVASTVDGRPTTLGRNGSDFSASIFGALLDADEVVIWTDVDGVMSGDPRLVEDSVRVPELSYDEAMELAYFGAKVLHPSTMTPLVRHGIPLRIRSSFVPDAPGTRILPGRSETAQVKGISVVDDMALVNVQGAGMIGVPGTADRLFGALRDAGISVVLISQGSSEHSICFAVAGARAEAARDAVARAFALELSEGQIQSVEVERDCSVLAVVGDGMQGVPGVAGTLFGALGRAGVNVRAIAQGASERNISAVIRTGEAPRALRAVHAGFYLSPQSLSVGLVGPGTVGSEFLRQLRAELPRLRREARIDVRIRGIVNSTRMLLTPGEVDLDGWEGALAAATEPADLEAFARHIDAEHLPHAVILDCSAAAAPADLYAAWLSRGIHVITANKKAGSGPLEAFRSLEAARRTGGSRFLHETTVGAGLPILGTLQGLRETGDRIHSVEGIFSGTLAYLFNTFDASRPFSDIVRHARDIGYTEPDPRDDLTGMDVARKVVILAREIGLDMELEDVEVESLVPDDLMNGGVEEFLTGLASVDEVLAARHAEARAAGEVLRYVGRLTSDGEATVALRALPRDHPLAGIALTDNVVQFRTDRYSENPLVVRGPGAGPAVTAAGVFGDLLRLCGFLGADVG